MKLQISIGQPPLAGFTNIDAAKHQIDLGKLDNICEAAECTEIIINDVLKFMPYDNIPAVINHMASRLRHKGQIVFIFTDINSIIREYNRGAIDEKTLNELLYSGGRSAPSYDYILRIIKAVKLEVAQVDISKEQVTIVAKRQ